MTVTFDPAKDAANMAKHGVSLALATELELDAMLTWPDTRRDYGEPRMVGLAPWGTRLYFLVYVARSEGRRIISLRKANAREVKIYVAND